MVALEAPVVKRVTKIVTKIVPAIVVIYTAIQAQNA